MPNTFDPLIPEIWTNYIQDVLHKNLVGLQIADASLKADLKKGDTLHIPYFTELTVSDYTPGTAISISDVTTTDDTITIDKKKVAPFYIDNVEELQVKPDIIGKLSEDAAYKLRDAIDTDVLAHVADAESIMGNDGTNDYVIGGINEITVDTSKIITLFSKASKVLRDNNVEQVNDWVAVIRPEIYQVIEEKVASTGAALADKVLENGYGGRFMGFDLYVSNNLPTDTGGKKLMYLGRKGQISLVLQQDVKMEIKEVSNKLGRNFIPWVVYGTGVLYQAKKRFIAVRATV